MNLIGDVEEVFAIVEQLKQLSGSGQIAADVAALESDVAQLKVLSASVVSAVKDIVSQLSPELRALFPQVTKPSAPPKV